MYEAREEGEDCVMSMLEELESFSHCSKIKDCAALIKFCMKSCSTSESEEIGKFSLCIMPLSLKKFLVYINY